MDNVCVVETLGSSSRLMFDCGAGIPVGAIRRSSHIAASTRDSVHTVGALLSITNNNGIAGLQGGVIEVGHSGLGSFS